MLSLLKLERKQKKFFKSISNSHISQFLSYSFAIETINTFIHSRSSLNNQNGQSVYPFSDPDGAKTLPDGVEHTYTANIREYPPPPRLGYQI